MLHSAATIIQANYRGYLLRKRLKLVMEAAHCHANEQLQGSNDEYDYEEELTLDCIDESFLDADLKPLSPRSAPRLLLAADSNSGNSNSNNSNLNLNPPVEQTLVPAFTLPWAVETEVTLEQRMRDEGWLGGGGGGGGGWAPTASITGPSSIDTSDAQTRNYNTFSGSPVPSNADLHSVASALSSVQLPSSSTTPPPSPPPLAPLKKHQAWTDSSTSFLPSVGGGGDGDDVGGLGGCGEDVMFGNDGGESVVLVDDASVFSGSPLRGPKPKLAGGPGGNETTGRKGENWKEDLANEWGFSNLSTAEMMLKRAKRQQKLQLNAAMRKKLENPTERLALFHHKHKQQANPSHKRRLQHRGIVSPVLMSDHSPPRPAEGKKELVYQWAHDQQHVIKHSGSSDHTKHHHPPPPPSSSFPPSPSIIPAPSLSLGQAPPNARQHHHHHCPAKRGEKRQYYQQHQLGEGRRRGRRRRKAAGGGEEEEEEMDEWEQRAGCFLPPLEPHILAGHMPQLVSSEAQNKLLKKNAHTKHSKEN